MILGSDGNFYGSTYSGGTSSNGTVFRLETNSTENVTFNSPTTIPIVTTGYSINGAALNLNLGFAPVTGKVLTLVQNTGGGSDQRYL